MSASNIEPVGAFHRASGSHTLSELLAVVSAGAYGFAYTPREAIWLRIERGRLVDHAGESHDTSIYELRLFDGAADWRWRRDGGRNYSAWIGETEPPQGFAPVLGLGGKVDPVVRRSLLWGLVESSTPSGWSRLGVARIKPFYVPVPLKVGEGIAMEIVEYIGRLDEHGNVGVIDERIVALSEAKCAVKERS